MAQQDNAAIRGTLQRLMFSEYCPLTKEQIQDLVNKHGNSAPTSAVSEVILIFRPAYEQEDNLYFVPTAEVLKAISVSQIDAALKRTMQALLKEVEANLSAALRATLSGSNHFPTGQALQPGAVGRPSGITIGGHGPVVVEVYALGAGVVAAAQGDDLSLAQGAFELEAAGRRLVFDPSRAGHTQWLVAPIQRDVTVTSNAVQTVDEESACEIDLGVAHEAPLLKTAILALPQGWGKTTIAAALAHRLGCTSVIDDWAFGQQMTQGALHLTNAEVPTC